jgi:hypothetical protein
MQGDVDNQALIRPVTEDWDQNQMGRGADGKKFGNSLNQGKDYKMKKKQNNLSVCHTP